MRREQFYVTSYYDGLMSGWQCLLLWLVKRQCRVATTHQQADQLDRLKSALYAIGNSIDAHLSLWRVKTRKRTAGDIVREKEARDSA